RTAVETSVKLHDVVLRGQPTTSGIALELTYHADSLPRANKEGHSKRAPGVSAQPLHRGNEHQWFSVLLRQPYPYVVDNASPGTLVEEAEREFKQELVRSRMARVRVRRPDTQLTRPPVVPPKSKNREC